jgi:hypothetical protein
MAPVKRSAWLLTTRRRAAMAVGLTAFLFALSIKDELHGSRVKPLWPLFDGLLHGWLIVAINVAFYGYFCWLAYWFIYRSKGWERVFFGGWFGPFLLSPLKVLHPEWAALVRHVETFGNTLSLLVALSFLLNAPPSHLKVRDQSDV